MAQDSRFRSDTTNVSLIKQGAEAKIYSCIYQGRPTIIKERFKKLYRHPVLDKNLTVRRTRAEAKCIQRCQKVGIRCPEVYFVDSKTNMIYMEHIVNSVTIKDYITNQLSVGKPSKLIGETATVVGAGPKDGSVDSAPTEDRVSTLLSLGTEIGRILGTMHRNHLIHGDLTTSNFLLEGRPEDIRVVVIDFGLGSYSESSEDKGVDLYVLERALSSTHSSTERLFEAIIESYKTAYEQGDNDGGQTKSNKKPSAEQVLRKLNEVRLRGRKRTMVG